MLDARRWAARSMLSVVVLSLVAASLLALVVAMSTSRLGTIRLQENSLARSIGIGPGILGGHRQPPCRAVGAQCRRAVGPPRGRSTPVPSWQLALAGLLAVGAASVLWKTRRTQQSDAISMSSSLESPPGIRRTPSNPREIVLAAFADVEERLASRGTARDTWEAPESYLSRAIPGGWHLSRATHTLARLYALARYSHHSIDAAAAAQALAASTELATRLDSDSTI
jgi:hypothetical protein